MNLKKLFLDFVREEEGLTMVEYAVAGGVIAAGLLLAFTQLGTAVKTKVCAIVNGLSPGTCS